VGRLGAWRSVATLGALLELRLELAALEVAREQVADDSETELGHLLAPRGLGVGHRVLLGWVMPGCRHP
jgi:hypothetical protein